VYGREKEVDGRKSAKDVMVRKGEGRGRIFRFKWGGGNFDKQRAR